MFLIYNFKLTGLHTVGIWIIGTDPGIFPGVRRIYIVVGGGLILLCEFNKFKFSRWVQVGPSNFQYQIHIVYTCLHKDHNVRATLDFFYKIKSLYLKTYNAFATIRYISVLYIT